MDSVSSSHSDEPAVATSGGASSSSQAVASSQAGATPCSSIQLEKVPNFRDLSEACPLIVSGRLMRCAKPSDATSADIQQLLNHRGVRILIDLRSDEELQEDVEGGSALFQRAELVQHARSWFGGGTLQPRRRAQHHLPAAQQHPAAAGQQQEWESNPLQQDQPQAGESDATGPHVVHHQVSLLERNRYYGALLRHVPLTTVMYATALGLVNRKWARPVLLREVNSGGLLLLYKILVDSAKPEIRAVMELVLQGLEWRSPVLFFCKAGKDRTGLVACLLLSCVGASREQIVSDYCRSDAFHKVALAGIENKPELQGLDRAQFERAPAQAMEGLLAYLDQHYGSAAGYLESIGFGADKQARLRQLLTAPARGATAAGAAVGQ